MNEKKLQEAVSLYKHGNKSQAVNLLGEIVRQDPNNSVAWYGLALYLDELDKKVYCLKKVLNLDPSHQKAQQLLEKLQSEKNPSAVNKNLATNHYHLIPKKAGSDKVTKKIFDKTALNNKKLTYALFGMVLIIIMCITIAGGFWVNQIQNPFQSNIQNTAQATDQETIQVNNQSEPTPEAVDAMILAYVDFAYKNEWKHNISEWDKQRVTDFENLNLSAADQANGIQERVCITLSYIEKDNKGEWQDRSLSYSMEMKLNVWQADSFLMGTNNQGSGYYMNIFEGNCNFAREYYGVTN